MNCLYLTVALALCWMAGAVTAESCEYADIHRRHSMCFDDGKSVDLTTAQRDTLIHLHNNMRSGALKVNALNMLEMAWNDELAAVARKWAGQCRNYSESNSKRRQIKGLPGVDIGQNVFKYIPGNLYDAVDAWEAGKKTFEYGKALTQSEADALLPYAQMIHATTGQFGCGRAVCSETREVLVCNYAERLMNDPASVARPYDAVGEGEFPCDTCRPNCDAGGFLCTCSTVCTGGKTLDPKACTCA